MSPPHYVQACTLLAEGYLLSMGVRDLVAPGQPLSLPGDVAVMGLYGDLSAGTLDGKKALALSQFFGALMVALGLLKLVTVFTNPEGTYLRRNLMLAIGVGDLLIFAFLQKHTQPLADGLQLDLLPTKAAFLLEAAALLLDAVLRPRQKKAVSKAA